MLDACGNIFNCRRFQDNRARAFFCVGICHRCGLRGEQRGQSMACHHDADTLEKSGSHKSEDMLSVADKRCAGDTVIASAKRRQRRVEEILQRSRGE